MTRDVQAVGAVTRSQGNPIITRNKVEGALYVAAATLLGGSTVGASSLIAQIAPALSQPLRYRIGAAALVAILCARGRCFPRLRVREFIRVPVIALRGMVGFNFCLLATLRHGDPAVVRGVVGCLPVALAVCTPSQPGHI